MKVQSSIQSKLERALNSSLLKVVNESHMHNVPANSETHFRVEIVSEEFNDKPLLARHRLINKLLAEELNGGVHALSLHTFTAGEWAARGNSATPSPACEGGSASES